MVAVDLCDSLSFVEEPSGRVDLRCAFAFPGRPCDADRSSWAPDPNNLVFRAAHLLRAATGTTKGVAIRLTKRIPWAAGLGGGSSDAAATLVGLNDLWGLGLSRGELLDLGARLGSDIPFFLAGSNAAVCRGRGEQVEPVALGAPLACVVVRPATGLSTAEVFRHCRPAAAPLPVGPLVDFLRHGRIADLARRLHNALQPPAVALNADVARLQGRFENSQVLGHALSGSGSAWFGLCANRRRATTVAARMQAAGAGRVHVVRCRA
jgi:4-diphosphocytidyl-2-C-methyl-D-erythritol kinase